MTKDSFLRKHTGLIALILIALLWVGIHAASLTTFPPVHCDEGWYSDMALQFVQSGEYTFTLFDNIYGEADHQALWGRLYIAGLGITYMVLGFGVWQARLLSLFGIVALILASYAVGRRLYNQRTGIIAALFNAFAWDVMFRGHFARPEIWLAVCEVLLLGLYWHIIEKPDFKKALLFGFAVAIPMNLHPDQLLFALGFGFLTVVELGFKQRRFGALAGAGLGAAVGGLLWVAVQMMPDLAASYEQIANFKHSPIGLSLLDLLRSQVVWMGEVFWVAYNRAAILQASYYLLAFGLTIWKRRRPSVTIAVLVAISMLGYALLISNKHTAGTVLWVSLMTILVAGELESLVMLVKKWLPAKIQQDALLQYMFAAPLLMAYIAGNMWLVYRYRDYDYQALFTEFVDEYTEPGSVIIAPSTWWYATKANDRQLFEDDYFWYLEMRDGFLNKSTLIEEFESLKIDYVILSGSFGCRFSPDPTYDLYTNFVTETCDPVVSGHIIPRPSPTGYSENTLYACPYGQ